MRDVRRCPVVGLHRAVIPRRDVTPQQYVAVARTRDATHPRHGRLGVGVRPSLVELAAQHVLRVAHLGRAIGLQRAVAELAITRLPGRVVLRLPHCGLGGLLARELELLRVHPPPEANVLNAVGRKVDVALGHLLVGAVVPRDAVDHWRQPLPCMG